MSLQVFSDDNKVLVDSALQHLHYGGQATFTASYTGPTSFTGYTGTNSTIDGHVIYSYTYVSEGAPTIFIRPTDYTKWHALIRQEFISVTKTWQLEIIQSGSSTASPPELHIFLPSTYLPRSTETKGIQLFGDVALRGPTAEKVMTVSQLRSVEPSLTTEAAANQAAVDMSTAPTPLQIAGASVTLTGSATAPAAPALGDLWVNIGSHPNGFYPKPIDPTYPTLLEVTMEERTWDGLDAYMALQGAVMHNGTGTQVFGVDVMKYLSFLNDWNWCASNNLYSWFNSSSRTDLLYAITPVVTAYWNTALGPPQASDGYYNLSLALSYWNAEPDGFYTYSQGWEQYYTGDDEIHGWKEYFQLRYDAYQIAYTQHLTDVSTANSAALAIYNEEVYMYTQLLAGYNAHYSSVPDVNPSYMYGKSNYGVDSAGSLIVSSPDEWLPIVEGLDASIKQYLTGALNTVYSVAAPVQIEQPQEPVTIMPEGVSFAGWTVYADTLLGSLGAPSLIPGGGTYHLNIVEDIIQGLIYRYIDGLPGATEFLLWDDTSYWYAPHLTAAHANTYASLPYTDPWAASGYNVGMVHLATYFGFADFGAMWAMFGEPPTLTDRSLKVSYSTFITMLATWVAEQTTLWDAYNTQLAIYNGYAAELAAWGANRDAYYATMVASQAVTADVSVSGAPSLVSEIYASFEYTYDWNVFTTVTTGAVNTHTFDSRLQPLALVSGGSIISPATPVSAGSPQTTGELGAQYIASGNFDNPNGVVGNYQGTMAAFGGTSAPGTTQNDWDFKTYDHSSSHPLTTGLTQSNLMFAAPSLTQAVQQRTIRGFGEGPVFEFYLSSTVLIDINQSFSEATWWTMYLNAFKLENNSFKSGWVTYDAGFEYAAHWKGGLATWWWDTDDPLYASTNYGSVPYEPKTINHTSNMYLIADVTRYT